MATKKKTVKKKNVKAETKPSLLDKYKDLFARDKFLWFLLTAGIVLIVGGTIFGGIVAYEKWQFNKAEKALDSLYADIVAELGQPINVEKDKSCGYSSAKFNKGRLACRVGYKLDYRANDYTELAKDFVTVASSSANISSVDKSLFRYDDIGAYLIDFRFKNVGISCGATINSESDKEYISLSCGDNPFHQVYELRE